jgi:hypothetical protein
MDIKDLKTAWDTYSSQELDKHRLGQESIHELLKNRTQTLVERMDRNIRIGMFVLFAYIAYGLFDDIYLSKILIKEPLQYPAWLIPFDIFSDILIVTTYLFFVIRYLKIKRNFYFNLQLKSLLTGIKDTLITYRRMFYLALIILLLNIMVSFSAGLYQGIMLHSDSISGGTGTLSTSKIFIMIGAGLVVLVLLNALIFLFLRWGFNKLYGQYLIKISETLRELDESDHSE